MIEIKNNTNNKKNEIIQSKTYSTNWIKIQQKQSIKIKTSVASVRLNINIKINSNTIKMMAVWLST